MLTLVCNRISTALFLVLIMHMRVIKSCMTAIQCSVNKTKKHTVLSNVYKTSNLSTHLYIYGIFLTYSFPQLEIILTCTHIWFQDVQQQQKVSHSLRQQKSRERKRNKQHAWSRNVIPANSMRSTSANGRKASTNSASFRIRRQFDFPLTKKTNKKYTISEHHFFC